MSLAEQELVELPVDELRTHPANPRRGDVDKIAESIEAHGFYGALIVQRSTNYIIAGNHRFLAAKKLGFATVPGFVIDVDDDTARRILLVDNRSSDLATYDEAALIALLEELTVSEQQLAGTLFTEADLAKLVAERDADAEEGEGTGPGFTFDVFDAQSVAQAAFEHYRQAGYPEVVVPRHLSMIALNQLAATPTSRLATTRVGYSTADTYHPHRFDAHGRRMRSPRESFEDDGRLRHAIEFVLEHAGSFSDTMFAAVLGWTNYTQAASNFRPGFALNLLRRFAPEGATVLDTSTGYGGRLVGFFASNCSTYIGIDPSTKTYEGNMTLTRELCPPGKNVELHCLPAEDVEHSVVAGRADLCLTSPPYFDQEFYCDEETQSSARYKTAPKWRHGFLLPMLKLQFAALREGSVSLINIAEVRLDNGKTLPLPDWCVEDALAVGFKLDSIEHYKLSKMPGANLDEEREATEPLLVLRKE
jgi:ParB-like chromosome segregation protein Spo0J